MTNLDIPLEGDHRLSRQSLAAGWMYWISLSIFLISAIIIIFIQAMAGTRQANQLQLLVPIILIISLFSLFGFLWMSIRKAGWKVLISAVFLLPLIISIGGIAVHRTIWRQMDARDEDIYFTFKEGERLLQGQNLYERILGSDMRNNDKYATYLPMFYQMARLTQAMGLDHFARWMLFWREIFLLFNVAIGLLLFYVPYQKGSLILAVFASLFWLFNRWTLTATVSADFDFIPMFLLLLGIIILPQRWLISGLLIGFSLSLKHFGIFIVPVLLIMVWQTANLKKMLFYLLSISAIPLLISMPFLISNWKPFVLSILFSATRYPFSSLRIDSMDAVLGWVGIPAKLPMLVLMGMIYLLTFGLNRQVYILSLLATAVFAFFNSVFFPDYVMYLVPFIPLAASEVLVLWKPENLIDTVSFKLREKYYEWRAR